MVARFDGRARHRGDADDASGVDRRRERGQLRVARVMVERTVGSRAALAAPAPREAAHDRDLVVALARRADADLFYGDESRRARASRRVRRWVLARLLVQATSLAGGAAGDRAAFVLGA